MRLFEPLYERALQLSGHPRATWYLSGLSFIEAFIFPVPPEVMLMPMGLGKPARVFTYANLSLLFSLLGSLVGYGLGHYAFDILSPLLARLNLLDEIMHAVDSLRTEMGSHWVSMLVVLVVAAIQPVIPMKVVTWASGIIGVPLPAFVLCIALGRAKRVYLLAILIRLFGRRAEEIIHRHVERIGWIVIGLLLIAGVWWLWLR